ncbi:hypothetical protein JVU11DRAFT_2745 [Chiua virens]|nr:hypothetical protein JVU11DRAFT_2745 [Chiua virens]
MSTTGMHGTLPVRAEKLEEQWTSTTIQAAFTFRLTSPKSSSFSIDLPLPHLGWSFALSLSPLSLKQSRGPTRKKERTTDTRVYVSDRIASTYDCTPVRFSFRQDGNSNPWGDTSLQAQLSLASFQHNAADTTSTSETEGTTQNNMNYDSARMPLGTLQAVLSRDSLMVLPLTTVGSISLQQPIKIWLNVMISGCPFSNGFFRFDFANHVHEADAHTQLVRQCGDRLLTRSLATGKHFDVKFLTSPTRTGKTKKLHASYASLFVLEQKVDLPSSKLGDEWESALLALRRNNNADVKHAREISCPDGYEHEFDSDVEDGDEDEVSSPPPIDNEVGIRRDQLEGPQSDREISNSFMSSLESDQPEEIIQGFAEPHHMIDDNGHRTFLVKFAAHRTWRAFLWYCYTGHVEFNHLKSQHATEYGVRRPDIEDGPPFCSPKSMYRLADLVGNQALKDKALQAISERMDKKNILDETFSVFTSKYPDVRQAQMNILLRHIRSPKVKGAFVNMMKNFANMPHAEPILLALCDSTTVPTEM